MNKSIVLAFIFFLLQSTYAIVSDAGLHSYIQSALENNPDLKSEHLSLSQKETEFVKAKKQEFYPEIVMSGIVGGKSKKTEWIKEYEGIERKQITNTKEKSSVELDSSISRPHPFGGKVNLNLKMTEGLTTSNQDTWEASLNSEEPLSKSARQLLKTPFFDEQLQLDTAKLNLEEKINDIISESYQIRIYAYQRKYMK
ncbi:MAG: hypothetical protein V1749_09655 [Candidatus Desantisbacteria bacterium]